MRNTTKIFLMLSLVALVISPLISIESTSAQTTSLFKVTIIAPGNANFARRQWGQMFASSLMTLGIDARVVFLDWDPVYERCLTPPTDLVGKTFDEGGWDILLLGWTPGLIPEPRQIFYGGPGFFAPDGQNYYLWNSSASNALLDQFITSTNRTEQDATLEQWQTVYFNDMPASQIVYQSAPAAASPRIQFDNTASGEGWLYFNVQCNPEWLRVINGSTEVTYAAPGEIVSLIPPDSNSWYDTIINSVIYNGLVQVSGSNLSDLTVPALLTSWNHTSDGFNWTYNLRHGVTWHDGFPFSADDVLFSLYALMTPPSQFIGYYQSVYGDNIDFKWENGTTTTLGNGTRHGNISARDAYTVDIKLPVLVNGKPYGYIDPFLLGFANNIIPKHIFEKIPTSQWLSSPFNTGRGTMTIGNITYNGPIGTGPYKWVNYDTVTQTVHMTKYMNYWNRTGLESEDLFQVTDYNVRFIPDKTPALAALKNGEVDILDTNYQMQIDVPSIQAPWGKAMIEEGTGRQEIGYNMEHPIFGTGVDTPLGKQTPSRAAEAARNIRAAFDAAIPRQLIIDSLLAGYGTPGVTPMLPTQPFYNASITARTLDLAAARQYLQNAGYTVPGAAPPPVVPSFLLGMSTSVSGFWKDPDGNPLPDEAIWLMESPDNSTENATRIGETITDPVDAFYSLTINPSAAGTWYYYIFDQAAPTGQEFTYLTSINVSTLQDNLTPLQNSINSLQGSVNNLMYIAIIALVVAIVLGGIAIYMSRRTQTKKPS